jgi:hypothetical protein
MSSTYVGESSMLLAQGENIATLKNKKGKNFAIEKVLCTNFLHLFQDPMIGNGQKLTTLTTFWEKVHFHYNVN